MSSSSSSHDSSSSEWTFSSDEEMDQKILMFFQSVFNKPKKIHLFQTIVILTNYLHCH